MRRLLAAVVLSVLSLSPALACGLMPPLGTVLDKFIAEQTSDPRLAEIKAKRAVIAKLAQAGKEEEARNLEEQVMAAIGFEKTWLRCGPGTFFWRKKEQHPS